MNGTTVILVGVRAYIGSNRCPKPSAGHTESSGKRNPARTKAGWWALGLTVIGTAVWVVLPVITAVTLDL